MSQNSSYQPTFFVVPSRIMDLPGLTLAFLKFYETVFQFWNHHKPCYLSNKMLMERTGIKSISTIQEAFCFFIEHGEMKKEIRGKKRYLVPPEVPLEVEEEETEEPVDNFSNNSTKNSQPIAEPIGGYRPTDREGIATAIGTIPKKEENHNVKSTSYKSSAFPNIKNINIKNNNKSNFVQKKYIPFPTAIRASSLLEEYMNRKSTER